MMSAVEASVKFSEGRDQVYWGEVGLGRLKERGWYLEAK